MREPYQWGQGRRLVVETGPGVAEAGSWRLLEFAAFCLLLSWVPWGVMGALGTNIDEGAGSLAFGLAAAGPSLAALVMWLMHRRDESPGPGVRWSIGWPIAAVLLGGIATVGAAVLSNLSDLSAIPRHANATIVDVGGPLAALGMTFLAGPVSEEFGWRGYVQPRLRRHFGRGVTTAIIGAAWGLWHVPLYFLDGTGQHDDGLFSQQGAAFFLALFPISYLMLFVTERLRGGVPAAILVHAAWNLTDALVPPLGVGGIWLKLVLLTGAAAAAGLYWRTTPALRVVGVRSPTAAA